MITAVNHNGATRTSCLRLAKLLLIGGLAVWPVMVTADDQAAGGVSSEEFLLLLSRQTTEQVDGLIHELGSPVYAEREAASEELTEIGPSAFRQLREAYLATDDLEVRLRIEATVHESYLDFHVFGRNGFLGIQQDLTAVTEAQDPRVERGQLGIRITRVIPDTGAAAAKLQKDDIIVEFNGEPLRVEGSEPTVVFGDQLRLLGPGVVIKLVVLRGSGKKEIEATLGRRPKRYYTARSSARQMLHDERQKFDAWWIHHFRRRADSAEGD